MGGGKSGGGSTTVQHQVDEEYNRRMADIAEAQQALAQEMAGIYREYGLPAEVLQPAMMERLAPYQTAGQIAQMQAGMEMMPHEMAHRRGELGIGTAEMAAAMDPTIWGAGSHINAPEARAQRAANLGNIQGTNEDIVREHYLQLFGREPDREGLEWWTQAMNEGRVNRDNLYDHMVTASDPRDLHHYDTFGTHAGGANMFTHQAELLRDQLGAQRQILPEHTGLTLEQIAAQRELLPHQTGLSIDEIETRRGLLPQASRTVRDFWRTARDGVDVQGRMGLAQADITRGYQGVADQQRMADARMGLRPDSGAAMMRQGALQTQQAGDIAGARTLARHQAEQDQFQRLQAAGTSGLGYLGGGI